MFEKMISVIIPTYNGGELLRKSLLTWSQQTMSDSDFEVIVVDNNSQEDIRSIVNDVCAEVHRTTWNVRYIFEPKAGATNARHAGARASKGEILVFADNDGLYGGGNLISIREAFKQMPEVGAVACKIDLSWDTTPPKWIEQYAYMLGQLDYGNEIRRGKLYFNSGLFAIKRSVFEQVHGFNPDLIGGKMIGDGDTGLVMKLWNAGIPIGWTPFATMQHMQQVAKHGSVDGVALHFYNVGVANSYALFRKNDFFYTKSVRKHRMISWLLSVKYWFLYNILRHRNRTTYFSMRQHQGERDFYRNLRNPDVRQEVMKKDLY